MAFNERNLMSYKGVDNQIAELYDKIQSCQKCKSTGAKKLRWPWVGKYYWEDRVQYKILFVGINMNSPGEDDIDLRKFINKPEVQKSFLSNQGLYGFMPKLIKQLFSLEESTPRQLYEYFAFTNIIKCSPINVNESRSKPTKEMWSKCSYIKDEIELFKPDIVVAMGDNCYSYIIEKYGKHQSKDVNIADKLKEYVTKVEIQSKVIRIIKIDHQSKPVAVYSTSNRLPLVLELLKLEFNDLETSNVITKIEKKLNEVELRYFIADRLMLAAFQA